MIGDPVRDPDTAIVTPSLAEMAKHPGATQVRYRVTYTRVGRRGGRDGTRPPVPLTVWTASERGLLECIERDVRPYLASRFIDVAIDFDAMTGWVLAGVHTAGEFTVERLAVFEGRGGPDA